MNQICESCYTAIPAGQAVIRSVGFEVTDRVTWHRACWEIDRHSLRAARATAALGRRCAA